MSIREAIEKTIRLLELVEVRGESNRQALSAAVGNLENIVLAIIESERQKEDEQNEGNNEQGSDVRD